MSTRHYGPPMSADDRSQPGALERLADVAASAGGGLLGFGIAGAEGAAIGNAAAPAVALAWHLGNSALIARLTRGGRALDHAATDLGTDLDDLARRATADPDRLELLARILEAAGRTALDAKIPALGRVLAAGLDPHTQVDEALKLAASLDDLEAPDVQVLHLLHRETVGPLLLAQQVGRELGAAGGVGWTVSDLHSRLPGYRLLIPTILRTLDRHALIADADRGIFFDKENPDRWTVTDFGRHCLELLSAPEEPA